MKTIRIFISSPGDVAVEREKARKVVEGLQKRYAGRLRLETVLWEDLPLGAVDSFQGGIDVMLKGEQAIDIAVFILWSRLGSPLGAAIRKPDGSAYRSGTEREFDLMLKAYEQSGQTRPKIFAYVRQDQDGFIEAQRGKDTATLSEMVRQREMLESFIREEFHDPETGTNLRAYHTFPQPSTFAVRLRQHLRALLDEMAAEAGVPVDQQWENEPYIGLRAFDLQHAPIFFGREQETSAVLEALQQQQHNGCAFVLLVGGSGSGKSSLVRAGVIPDLLQSGDDEGVSWRRAVLTPGECTNGLLLGLARSLLAKDAIPELREDDGIMQELASDFASAPKQAAQQVRRTLQRISSGPTATHLVLLVDQFEEVFTHAAFAESDIQSFTEALKALAECTRVSILATVRSDFYDRCQHFPILMAMKGDRGQMDLLPPKPSDIHRIITSPAVLAGLTFEKNAGGESLDQRILNDAVGHPEALPLIEFALAALYEARTAEGLLTFAAYDKLGGVEGAIGRHAEAVFAAQPESVRAAFGPVFQTLVALDETDEARPIRRRVATDALAATPESRLLFEALLAARLLSSDRGEVFVVHESLLRRWERIVQWIEANRDRLRVRDRIATRMAEGAPLADNDPLTSLARYHFATSPAAFEPEMRNYIATQLARMDATRRRRKCAHFVLFLFIGMVTIVSLTWLAVTMSFEGALRNAHQREESTTRAYQDGILFWCADWLVELRTINRPDLIKEVGVPSGNYDWEGYIPTPHAYEFICRKILKRDVPIYPCASVLYSRATLCKGDGDVRRLLGDVAEARECYSNGLRIITNHMVARKELLETTEWTSREEFNLHMLAGDLKQRLNDFEGALASYQSAFEAQRRLPPDRGDFIRFHMSCANALLCQSNPEAANVHYRAALSQMEGLRCDGLGQGEVRSEMGIHSTLGFGFFNFTSVRRCFLQLLLKDFQNAKVGALADLGSRKQPLNDYNLMGFCLPHIHMYLGEKSQAEELYRRYKGRILHNGSTWEEAVAEDFATFRKLGMEHPQMKEIEALLEIAPTVKKKPVNPTNRVEQAEGITP